MRTMGPLPPYARVYCAVWSISKPNGTLPHGMGLNANQIVNKLRRSVPSWKTCFLPSSTMIQTWKTTKNHASENHDFPNTYKNHASANRIFLRARGWTAVGVSETEKNQIRKTVLAHLQHISSSTRTDE